MTTPAPVKPWQVSADQCPCSFANAQKVGSCDACERRCPSDELSTQMAGAAEGDFCGACTHDETFVCSPCRLGERSVLDATHIGAPAGFDVMRNPVCEGCLVALQRMGTPVYVGELAHSWRCAVTERVDGHTAGMKWRDGWACECGWQNDKRRTVCPYCGEPKVAEADALEGR